MYVQMKWLDDPCMVVLYRMIEISRMVKMRSRMLSKSLGRKEVASFDWKYTWSLIQINDQPSK